MAQGKKFAAEFALRRNVSALDKILIQDSDDDVVKYAYPPQIASLSGYAYANSIQELPTIPKNKAIGYIVGQMLYIYVGEGGDTRNGLYQSVGFFVGPQGVQGEKGEQGERGEQGVQGPKGDNGGISFADLDAYLTEKKYLTTGALEDVLAGYVSATSLMRDYMTIATLQDVSGVKNFKAGIQFDGLAMYKSIDDTIFIDANVVVRGGFTVRGRNTTTTPTLFDALPIDERTIKRNAEGVLYVDEDALNISTGGGVADSVAWSNITDKPEWIDASKPSYTYSEIGETPDLTIYAKSESVTEALTKYVPLDTAQPITAQHDFTKGLLIDGLAIYKSTTDTIYIDANVVVRGGFTSRGTNKSITPSIFESLPIDEHTIKRNENGVLYVDSSSLNIGGGGGASLTKDAIIEALEYTPYNAANPAGYITSNVNGPISALAYKLNVYTSDTGIYRGSYYTSELSNDDIAVIGGRTAIISNVSIGGWEASAKLHVHGDAKVAGIIYAGDNNGTIIRNANSNWIIGETSLDGNIQIGTTSFAKARSLNNYHGSLSLTAEGGVEAQLAHLNSNPTLGSLDTNGVMRLATKYGWGLYSWIRNTGRGYIQVGTDSRYGSTHKGNDLILQVLGGNIAIGGETAEEKLHVYGNVKATSFVGDIVCSTISNVNTMNVGQSFDLLHPTNGKQISMSPVYTVFAYENPIKGIPTYLDGLDVYIRTGVNHAFSHKFKSNGDVDFSNNIYAKRYFANEGFVLANTGVDYCGLMAAPTISSIGNAKDIWLYNSTADIKVYTPYTFAVIGGNVALGGTTASEKLHVYGNILATGGITGRYTSDRRLKENIRKFSASKILMSLGGVFQFEYADSEVAKNNIYGGSHIGLIYQNVQGTALDRMCHENENGYGSLNYFEPSFISLIAGATMENVDEIANLKKEIRALRKCIEQLEKSA